ncbi:hypothetical protein AWB78_08633 [Caballeronia calidae]|uniref:Uncharacterized protein n=1 Tax=Caballeronia calidae TaxID=1777139 RepID=A0A158EKZ8_9BURK|nr:hypothetical protein AWB78_08633 [Caballeronia calidae]
MGLTDRMEQACLCATVRELSPPAPDAFVLLIELADPSLAQPDQLIDLVVAALRLQCGALRIMSHDQSQCVPLHFADDLGRCRLALCPVKLIEQFGKLLIASPRDCQNEFERPSAGPAQFIECFEVVQAKQAPVGHQHQPLDRRKSRKHRLERGQQRFRLCRIAVKYLVIDRQAFGRLHHAEHELPRDQAFLAHAELAHIVFLGAQSFGADRGQVVEHHRQVLVDHRPQQARDHPVNRLLLINQRVHAAQQVLVRDRFDIDLRQGHGFQPAQNAELRIRIAQPIEDHDPEQRLHIDRVPRAAEHTPQLAKAERLPKFGQRPDIAERACRLEAHSRRR